MFNCSFFICYFLNFSIYLFLIIVSFLRSIAIEIFYYYRFCSKYIFLDLFLKVTISISVSMTSFSLLLIFSVCFVSRIRSLSFYLIYSFFLIFYILDFFGSRLLFSKSHILSKIVFRLLVFFCLSLQFQHFFFFKISVYLNSFTHLLINSFLSFLLMYLCTAFLVSFKIFI